MFTSIRNWTSLTFYRSMTLACSFNYMSDGNSQSVICPWRKKGASNYGGIGHRLSSMGTFWHFSLYTTGCPQVFFYQNKTYSELSLSGACPWLSLPPMFPPKPVPFSLLSSTGPSFASVICFPSVGSPPAHFYYLCDFLNKLSLPMWTKKLHL